MDVIDHYVYSPAESAWHFTQDNNGDGQLDTWYNYGVAFNWARPTVHSDGANVTLLDGHVERVAFKDLWGARNAISGLVTNSFWYLED